MGFIPGLTLANQVNIRAYAHQMVCHLQNAQSIPLSRTSIHDVFRSKETERIRNVLNLFFEREELDVVLNNIGVENPFDTYIEGKMSGGQKTRFFLAVTLFRAVQKSAKIVFLDEPEQGQDPDLQIASFRAIHEFACRHRFTLFWITHMRPEPFRETNIECDAHIQIYKDGKISLR
jgi:ABC-type Mn2+/Zn2+ transport system ATPase subunit